ncbi:MAG: DEAD/DEAH box helicase [Planctomycetes bacterium]|nr:DEAD/DEAH box helicase [Planctomycetota bacterium]
MQDRREQPLVVQGDRTVLVEVASPGYLAARDSLARFAELVKSPEHVHTYRITPISIWNAAAAGMTAEAMIQVLEDHGKYALPPNVRSEVHDYASRYGRVRLERAGDHALALRSDDLALLEEACRSRALAPFLLQRPSPGTVLVDARWRGHVKQAMCRLGYPVEDLAGYRTGAPLPMDLRPAGPDGDGVELRPYQREAAEVFHANGSERGGAGVVVLPCGAGKTVVGLAVMARLGTHTLVLTTSTTAVRQWRRELLARTSLGPGEVGEYTGQTKDLRPVTLTTYQILTWRRRKTDAFPHFEVFDALDWGLVIYDEVHLLPAPVFRITAELQARRRLGLTATLVREDGREEEVFSLIGPKRYDVPWKVLERQGWIAAAACHEIRLPLPEGERLSYAVAPDRAKFRIASENPSKLPVVRRLMDRHREDRVLVIGQYLDQLRRIQRELGAPLITGATPAGERDRLYDGFRDGRIQTLILSRVGNFAIDLPDANVAIQVSGTFGSRQEEAQRLGRILRPKRDGGTARFYSIVSRDTTEQEFAANRQLFLTEQGYSYEILDGADLPSPAAEA